MLDRERHADVLQWVWFLNTHSDLIWKCVWGDKDTYRMAFQLAAKPQQYHQLRLHPYQALYKPHGSSSMLNHMGMLQPGPDGGLMFMHRTAAGKFWPHCVVRGAVGCDLEALTMPVGQSQLLAVVADPTMMSYRREQLDWQWQVEGCSSTNRSSTSSTGNGSSSSSREARGIGVGSQERTQEVPSSSRGGCSSEGHRTRVVEGSSDAEGQQEQQEEQQHERQIQQQEQQQQQQQQQQERQQQQEQQRQRESHLDEKQSQQEQEQQELEHCERPIQQQQQEAAAAAEGELQEHGHGSQQQTLDEKPAVDSAKVKLFVGELQEHGHGHGCQEQAVQQGTMGGSANGIVLQMGEIVHAVGSAKADFFVLPCDVASSEGRLPIPALTADRLPVGVRAALHEAQVAFEWTLAEWQEKHMQVVGSSVDDDDEYD